MKKEENQPTNIDSKIAKGLFAIGGLWTAIFTPVVLIMITFIIPFGNAATRSYILKIANTGFGKIALFLTISLPIWYGLQQILTILHKHNIHPKREKLTTYGLALAWTAHAIYILFVRM
jgi:fumarate reductase subunit D